MRPDRWTDGQTDMVIPVYPPNFVAGDIINAIKMFFLKSTFDIQILNCVDAYDAFVISPKCHR